MSLPRIAVSQAPYTRDPAQAWERIEGHLREAARRNLDLVVFPEWFLGLNPVEVLPNRHSERLGALARELGLTVVTGSVRALDPITGRKQQRGMVIEADGTLAGTQAKLNFLPTERPWFDSGGGLTPIPSRWGRILLLLGPDAQEEELWRQAEAFRPDLLCILPGLRTQREREAVQDQALAVSARAGCTVVLAPLTGRFSGTAYLGGALVAHRGRILAAGDESVPLLVAGDPEAPLIQLGTTDVSAVVPVGPLRPGAAAELRRAVGLEAERRLILDWDVLTAPDPPALTRELLEAARENPRWKALAPAVPGRPEWLRGALEAGAAGAFAYPGVSRLAPFADEVLALGEVLTGYRRPLVVHAGPGPAPLRLDAPELWDDFALRFPDVPLVVLHLGGPSPYREQAFCLAARHPQVFLETSGAPLPAVRAAAEELGPGRLLFGSGGGARDFEREWARLQELAPVLGERAFQAIVNDNGRRLFFTEPSAGGLSAMPALRAFRQPG
ncbi:Acyltransferase [Candidatus Hydrogenisulfobacillus filiaventi]|uniref:Acyltransferase n=1 Tax=Candidatus Hydrogenisulfobacillus filiaventi TaxID=2707344 RepID=A0A6F8ZKU4_9FIRM|nr:Acyltransferase [Candidatus Hydrogenisulfobacillus filiaventi]